MNEQQQSTSTARMQRLYALLDRALEVLPAEREAWIAALSGDDAVHAPRLRRMLAHAGVETDNFMRRPAAQQLADDVEEAPRADAPGDLVGPYRLIEPLGTGGMATVWLAERDDASPRRRVALKLPRVDWIEALAPRMARERDMLAALEHPNIARLYDAGITPQGRPWLAMERVDGVPIDLYALEHVPGVEDIAALALQVCDALAHAHARLIVHRDLKPANILVTPEGLVRLVDFGVAKLLHGDEHEPRTALTRLHGGAFTLDYASPEQVAGDALTTATDVYSLGVVLYELLVGERPYRARRDSAAALEEAILSGDVPLASVRCADRQRTRALRGDLDAVLARALVRNPAKRYPSVESMAADLRAFLEGRPVRARPPHWRYRASKFLRRHRMPLVAGALVGVSLLTGLAGTWTQALRAERERDRARDELRFAEASDGLLRTVLWEGAARPGQTHELLMRTERQLQQGYRDAPELRARLQLLLSDLLREFGDRDAAQQVLNRARESASASATGLPHELIVAKIECQQAMLIALRGQPREAQAQVVRTLVALGAPSPVNEDARLHCHAQGALVYGQAGDVASMRAHAQAGLAIIGSPPQPGQQMLAVTLEGRLAEALAREGDLRAAVQRLESLLTQLENVGLGGSRAVAELTRLLASHQRTSGHPRPALTVIERLLSRPDNRALDDPRLRQIQGQLLGRLGRLDEARDALSKALRQYESIGDAREQASTRLSIAWLSCTGGADTRECDHDLQAAERQIDVLYQRSPSAVAAPDLQRAFAALTEQRADDARSHAVATLAKLGALEQPGLMRIQAMGVPARAEQRLGHADVARDVAARAVEAARSALAGMAPADFLGHALAAQGEVLLGQGDHGGARDALQEALTNFDATLGNDATATQSARQALDGLGP